ncbi:MAG: PQQ-binding-like beta-propeller repeat protein [Burkholderiales bacterium]|jgi:outer membrane protein assembly factor BamB
MTLHGWRVRGSAGALIFLLMCVCAALTLSDRVQASDVFLMGERAGYGITRAYADSCFAIAPTSVTSGNTRVYAMRPGVYRLPVDVKQVYRQGFSIVRIGNDRDLCDSDEWSDGANLETALERTGIGTLLIGSGDGTKGHMYVRVTSVDSAGYLVVTPVRESDRLMSGMVGSRVLLEERDAGMLLDVDEQANHGRVIRQDYLAELVAPFFRSWTEQPEPEPEPVAESGPTIRFRHFIGKQSWRNNPFIVGTRIFVGSSGRQRNQSDSLDGVYSFDLLSGEKVWFVPTQADFNDLTYIKGLVIGGSDGGEVVGIGARSGTTYWTRRFDSPVVARPVSTGGAVAIATQSGELDVLELKDGTVKLSSELSGGVSGGLAADRDGLWIATETGELYRLAGFGEVQMRRNSRVYYPDELGHSLSGKAIDWYHRLGDGRGLRARISAAPLVLDNSIVLSLVREDDYDYPPVISFSKGGALDWIATDPKKIVNTPFGNSHLTPASWYDRLILADADSNSIYSVSRETGEVVWATKLGNPNFQLWSSPVVSDDYVYIATYDGFLHKFAADDGERIWSMFLGQHDMAGRTFFADDALPDLQSDPQWQSVPSSPIYATPAVSGNAIVVGTDEGYLYVINDPD